jgi:hypothetical protein
MLLKLIGLLIVVFYLSGVNFYRSFHEPKIYLFLILIVTAIAKVGFYDFWKNIKSSPLLLFLIIIFSQIIIFNNYRGLTGTNNIFDGFYLWLIILIISSSLKSLSHHDQNNLRQGIIFGCLIITGIIFYHGLSTLEITGYTVRKDGFLMYGWSDHLSLVLLAGVWLSRKSIFKLLMMIAMALIFAKSSIFLAFLSLNHKNFRRSLILGLLLIIFMQFYQTFLFENDTLYNFRGDRLSKREAISKKFNKPLPNNLLLINRDGDDYQSVYVVSINGKNINSFDYFYKPIYQSIDNDSKSFLGFLSNGRYSLWKYQVELYKDQVIKHPLKMFIGNGFQGLRSNNIIFLKKPVKPHLLILDIFISTGILGLIIYFKIAINLLGFWGNIALLPWYHSIEFTPVLIICWILNNKVEPIKFNFFNKDNKDKMQVPAE